MHSRANPLSSRHQIPSKGVWNVGKNGTKYSVINHTTLRLCLSSSKPTIHIPHKLSITVTR
ncbi:hypothetical protein LINGRAHAP2_LOCUS7308, partial [Linum grandiflorum]